LLIIRRIIREHGGEIDLSSDLGKGLTLTRIQCAPKTPPGPQHPQPISRGGSPRHGTGKWGQHGGKGRAETPPAPVGEPAK